MESKDVSLTISKDIVQPIVNAKVQEAVLAALGGGEAVVAKLLDQIISQKVDSTGKPSNYSDSKTWIEWAVNDRIREAIREEMKASIAEHSEQIKLHIRKHLANKKGQNAIAAALVDSIQKSLLSQWTSSFQIEFKKS